MAGLAGLLLDQGTKTNVIIQDPKIDIPKTSLRARNHKYEDLRQKAVEWKKEPERLLSSVPCPPFALREGLRGSYTL